MALCYKKSRTSIMQNMGQQVLLTAPCMFVFLEFSHESCLGLMLFPLGFQWWDCDNFWGCGSACVCIFDLINTWLFLCVSFLLLSVVCYICEFLWTFFSLQTYNWFDVRMRVGLWVYCSQRMQGLNWSETVTMRGQYHSTPYSLVLHLLLQILHQILTLRSVKH